MKCKNCNSENIYLYEFMGVGDCWHHIVCEDCKHKEFRNGGELIVYTQPKEYGPVYSLVRDNEIKWFVNFYEYDAERDKSKIAYNIFKDLEAEKF